MIKTLLISSSFLSLSVLLTEHTFSHMYIHVLKHTHTYTHIYILASCPLLLCYNIFDWTFPWGIPGVLWTRVTAVWSHTHTGERSLITVRWRCVHSCFMFVYASDFWQGYCRCFLWNVVRCGLWGYDWEPKDARFRFLNTVLKYKCRVSCTFF